MAGNIQWFRWYHGTCSDPKFALVARKSGASLPDVLAVWAYLLERASAAGDRGDFGDVDVEAVDCMFGFPDTRTAAVMAAMEERRLISGTRFVQWDKRQPKRERDDPDAAERKRAERERAERERAEKAGQGAAGDGGGHGEPPAATGGQAKPGGADAGAVTPAAAPACQCAPDQDADAHVTPCHATSRQIWPREEKRRKRNTNPPHPPADGGGAFAAWWAEWPEGPRKVDQVGCERHWRRARLDDEAEAVLAGLRAAAASDGWRKDGGAFVPAPRRWLRERRWLAPTEAEASAAQAEATWFDSRAGIEAKGVELGIGPWDEAAAQLGRGEYWPSYRARVFHAAGHVAGGVAA